MIKMRGLLLIAKGIAKFEAKSLLLGLGHFKALAVAIITQLQNKSLKPFLEI